MGCDCGTGTSCCNDTMCGWRANGGTCAECQIKIKYMKDGKCNCPLKSPKRTWDLWVKIQEGR